MTVSAYVKESQVIQVLSLYQKTLKSVHGLKVMQKPQQTRSLEKPAIKNGRKKERDRERWDGQMQGRYGRSKWSEAIGRVRTKRGAAVQCNRSVQPNSEARRLSTMQLQPRPKQKHINNSQGTQ